MQSMMTTYCIFLLQEDGASNKSSLASASFNYINSIIGSGVIGLVLTKFLYEANINQHIVI